MFIPFNDAGETEKFNKAISQNSLAGFNARQAKRYDKCELMKFNK